MAHLPILILSGALVLALVLVCVAVCATHRARAAARRVEAGVRTADADMAYVRDVLLLARREFDFHGGCVATDRPDLPLTPDTSWTVDFARARAAIDVAMDLLERAAPPTGTEDVGGGTTGLLSGPLSERSKYNPTSTACPGPEAFVGEIERLQGFSASIHSLAEEGLSGVLAARSACEAAQTALRPLEDGLRRDPSTSCIPRPQPLAADGSEPARRRGIELLAAALGGWLLARLAR